MSQQAPPASRCSRSPSSFPSLGSGSGSSTKALAVGLSCFMAATTSDTLHIRRRRVCVSPHSHIIKQWMKEQEAKKKAKGNLCHKKKQDGKRNSKGAHQGKPETHGYKTPY